jgi:tetratricopeptide (TPR) repeat protein
MRGRHHNAVILSAAKNLFALALCGLLTGAAKEKPKTKPAPKPKELHQTNFDEIIRKYTFVGDFEQHEAERDVSDEIFWRYPFTVPKIDFPIFHQITDVRRELPSTKGAGRAVDHLNRGRIMFLEGKYDEAKATWLSGRHRFGKEYPWHRRNDYFIGYSFLNMALRDMQEKKVGYDDPAIKSTMSNAATFLSWAFIVKVDQPDDLLEAVSPKGLYNLAATYWKYDRFAGAFGAADSGLNYLRKTGRKEYRSEFHRFVAEAHIKNRTYLEAVQSLDTAIRQDVDPSRAASSFARVGDIYFDLNNYDLAEDAYALGARIDEELKQINPAQLVLRGESLFWLGRFAESQKILHYALEGSSFRDVVQPLPPEHRAWASLRIADGYLAQKQIDKARLEYYKVAHEFRDNLPARIAKMRSACLELPFYGGNNVKHAREQLEVAKTWTTEVPPTAVELAWACQVGSYTDRERTPEMLERVRAFANTHPESRFLKSFVEPVRTFQANKIEDYFKGGDAYGAMAFFEANRKNLFPKVEEDLAARLFVAYADSYRPERAKEFWPAYHKLPTNDMKLIREATIAAELAPKGGATWQQRDRLHAQELMKRSWQIAPGEPQATYVRRLLATPSAKSHLPWVYRLAKAWGAKDSDYICDMEYPLLSKLYESEAGQRGMVAARVKDLIDQRLPALFKTDESCAISLLDLEARTIGAESKELAARYVRRQDWPLVGAFLHLFWTHAERLADQGDKDSARRMWTVIKDKGPPKAAETQFAKARLDPTQTEFEQLWN